jgi:hypothetical protein
MQKKIRVLADCTLDMFFKGDVTMLKTLVEEEEKRYVKTNTYNLLFVKSLSPVY